MVHPPPLTVKFCSLTYATALTQPIEGYDEQLELSFKLNTDLKKEDLKNTGITWTYLKNVAVTHETVVAFLQKWSTDFTYHRKQINNSIMRSTLLHVNEDKMLEFYIIYYDKTKVKFNFDDDTRWKSEVMFLKLLLYAANEISSTSESTTITLKECTQQLISKPEVISKLTTEYFKISISMKNVIDKLNTESNTASEALRKATDDYNDSLKHSAINDTPFVESFGGAKKRLHTRRRPRSNRTIHNKRTIRSRPHLSDVNSPQSSSADMLHLNKMS